jgi:hypothetical protein
MRFSNTQILRERPSFRGSGGVPLLSQSRSYSPVGKPIIAISHWKRLLAYFAMRLGRRPHMMTTNLVNRSACRARIEKLTIRHYRLVLPCENHFIDFGGFSLSARFRKTVLLVSVETTARS